MSYENLLIKAKNFSECDLVSSLLQDSIFHLSFHSFHEEHNCLRFMLNRFCWESVDSFEKDRCYYRVHSGLYIHNVKTIAANDNLKKNQYLNLLTFHSSKREINLVFSGNRHIRLGVSNILIYLKDLHDRYPTPAIPRHDFHGQSR